MKPDSLLDSSFGAVYRDLDLRTITDQAIEKILHEVYYHRLVIIKNQTLTTQEFVNFSERLGMPDPYLQENYHHPDYPVIFVSSNVERNGKKMGVSRTGGYWHTDTSFQPNPMALTMLYPQIIPKINRRSTLFVDMCEVYRKIPAELRMSLGKTQSLHSGRWHYKVRPGDAGLDISEILELIDLHAPPSKHPTIFPHPVTHEPILYISPGFTISIDGMNYSESDELLNLLFELATQDELVKSVDWEIGDIIIWDNRLLIHRSGRDTASAETLRQSVVKEEETMVYRICMRDSYPFHPGIEKEISK